MSILVAVIMVAASAVLVAVGVVRARQLARQGLHYQAAGIPLAFTAAGIAAYARSQWPVFAVATAVAGIITVAMLARAARYTRG